VKEFTIENLPNLSHLAQTISKWHPVEIKELDSTLFEKIAVQDWICIYV